MAGSMSPQIEGWGGVQEGGVRNGVGSALWSEGRAALCRRERPKLRDGRGPNSGTSETCPPSGTWSTAECY